MVMAPSLVKTKKEVREMKSMKAKVVEEGDGKSMDIFAPAWVQDNERVLKTKVTSKVSPPKTGSKDNEEGKKNKIVKQEKEAAEEEKKSKEEEGEEGERSLEMFAPAWVQENTKLLKTKAASKVSSSEEKDDNTSGRIGEAVGGLELAEIDQIELKHMMMKHPLNSKWTLWFYKNESRNWEENQRQVATFDTVEDFWALTNYISEANNIPVGTDYSLFKKGIFPDWEDVRNARGGRWMVNVDKNQRDKFLHHYWQEIMMLLIGESSLSHAHLVNGAVVNVRARGDKLGVWLADAREEEGVMAIGAMIKSALEIEEHTKIQFHVHKEEKAKGIRKILI